jgi:phosphatidylglycerophosphate synthase
VKLNKENRVKKTSKISWEDIKRIYPEEKARLSLIRNPWGYFVVRPISYRITPLFINLGFSANAVTVLEFLLIICGLAFIISGAVYRYNLIAGALIINLAGILDRIDGNIARFHNRCSKFGEMFDFTVGIFSASFLPLCLGISIYLGAANSMSIWGRKLPGLFWLLVGITDSWIYLFRRALSLKYQILAGDKAWKPRWKIVSILSAFPFSFKEPLLIVVLIIGVLDFFLFGYMVCNLVALLIIISMSLKKTKIYL